MGTWFFVPGGYALPPMIPQLLYECLPVCQGTAGLSLEMFQGHQDYDCKEPEGLLIGETTAAILL